jgi:hypothetical protein
MLRPILLASAVLLAGCVLPAADDPTDSSSAWPTATFRKAPSPGPSEPSSDAIPVVRWVSLFDTTDEDGHAWSPEQPGYHGCPDSFTIDKDAKKVRIMDFDSPDGPGLDAESAQAFVAEQLREPDQYYRNSRPILPMSRPYWHSLAMGNRGAPPVAVWLNATKLQIGSVEILPGQQKTLEFAYEWERDDRTVLDVKERLVVTHYGLWERPIELVEPEYCL